MNVHAILNCFRNLKFLFRVSFSDEIIEIKLQRQPVYWFALVSTVSSLKSFIFLSQFLIALLFRIFFKRHRLNCNIRQNTLKHFHGITRWYETEKNFVLRYSFLEVGRFFILHLNISFFSDYCLSLFSTWSFFQICERECPEPMN